MSAENGAVLKKPYMHKNKAEFDEFSADLAALLSLRKNKLDSVMTAGKLHSSV